jgi:hypothetical protein
MYLKGRHTSSLSRTSDGSRLKLFSQPVPHVCGMCEPGERPAQRKIISTEAGRCHSRQLGPTVQFFVKANILRNETSIVDIAAIHEGYS